MGNDHCEMRSRGKQTVSHVTFLWIVKAAWRSERSAGCVNAQLYITQRRTRLITLYRDINACTRTEWVQQRTAFLAAVLCLCSVSSVSVQSRQRCVRLPERPEWCVKMCHINDEWLFAGVAQMLDDALRGLGEPVSCTTSSTSPWRRANQYEHSVIGILSPQHVEFFFLTYI